MRIRFVVAGMLASCLALVLPALVQPQPGDAEKVSDEALRETIERYGREGGRDLQAQQPIIVHGERATNAIFEVLMIVRQHTGGMIRAGATPSVSLDSVHNPDEILRVIGNIEAPIPVDRLCEFIEQGLQPYSSGRCGCLDTALWLLAASGHPKGLAYLRYVRDCAAKSFDPDDRFWAARLDDCIRAWQTNNLFVRTGQFPRGEMVAKPYVMSYVDQPIAYAPSAATQAMRRAYEQDENVLAWDGRLDDAYLAERLPAVLPAMGDRTLFILGDRGFFGRFYEPVLAPLLLEWHEGRKQPLESLLGRPLVEAERATSRMEREALIPFLRMMTGDIALRIKKDVAFNSVSRTNDHAPMFLVHDPETWIGDLLKRGFEGSPAPAVRAGAALRGLRGLERPLADEERASLASLLTQPRVHVFNWRDWIRGDMDSGLRPLAHREPQAFREALNSPHLGSAVIDAVVAEKLYADKQTVFDRIEYAMLHDGDREIEKATPEQLKQRLDKLPPDLRARAQARLSNPPAASARRNVNANWLELVRKGFRDDPDGLAFLRRLAAKDDFASQKPMIEQRIEQMLNVHPEWK